MKTEQEIVKFTPAELKFVRKILVAEHDWYEIVKKNPLMVEKMYKKNKETNSAKELITWMNEKMALFATLKNDPDLLFQRKRSFAIRAVLYACETKSAFERKKAICLSVVAKLEKELAIVKKIDESYGIIYE